MGEGKEHIWMLTQDDALGDLDFLDGKNALIKISCQYMQQKIINLRKSETGFGQVLQEVKKRQKLPSDQTSFL